MYAPEKLTALLTDIPRIDRLTRLARLVRQWRADAHNMRADITRDCGPAAGLDRAADELEAHIMREAGFAP